MREILTAAVLGGSCGALAFVLLRRETPHVLRILGWVLAAKGACFLSLLVLAWHGWALLPMLATFILLSAGGTLAAGLWPRPGAAHAR